MKRKKLLKRCLRKYGKTMQLFIVMEELSELVKAICKFERGVTETNDDITEELADVYLVLKYVQMIYDIDKVDIKRVMREKEQRLQERIGEFQ